MNVSLKPPVLVVDGLCFSYPGYPVFNGLCAHIAPGVTLVRGGDGRGKSTLLRLMAGALPASEGHLTVNGTRLADDAKTYRQKVFWIDPSNDAHDGMTPRAYFEVLKQRFAGFDTPLVNELIAGLSLEPHLDKSLYMLSTGSKRKVWLAAAMASGADVVLMDGPFAALDQPSIAYLLECFRRAAPSPSAWLISHYEVPQDLPLVGVIELGD